MSRVIFEGSEWVSEDVKKPIEEIPVVPKQEYQNTTELIEEVNDSAISLAVDIGLFLLPIWFLFVVL